MRIYAYKNKNILCVYRIGLIDIVMYETILERLSEMDCSYRTLAEWTVNVKFVYCYPHSTKHQFKLMRLLHFFCLSNRRKFLIDRLKRCFVHTKQKPTASSTETL